MIFYDYWRSSSAWRVRLALHIKGIAFERRPVNLLTGENHGPAFRAINPMGQVPVLVIDDGAPRVLTESQAIIGYLEQLHPTPALFPSEPWKAARARQLAETIVSGIQPYQNVAFQLLIGKSGVPDPRVVSRQLIHRGLAALEAAARETAGTFLIGGAPTIADICLIPQLYGSRRLQVDLGAYPTLLRVEEACAGLPAFRAAHAETQSDAPKP